MDKAFAKTSDPPSPYYGVHCGLNPPTRHRPAVAQRKTTSTKRPATTTAAAAAAKPKATKRDAHKVPSDAKKPASSSTAAKTKRLTLDSMQDATIYHVTTRGNQWSVHKHGATRASGLYDTKAAAERAAAKFQAANKHIIVHRRDGSVERWITDKAA